MSTDNICFYGELTKVILQLSSNTLLICSTDSGSCVQKAPDSLAIPLGASGCCDLLLQHSLEIFSMFSFSEAKSKSMSFECDGNGVQE